MSGTNHVIVKFNMKNGSVLSCEYDYEWFSGHEGSPPESFVSEETYYIDDCEISFNNLPKGLEKIAEEMLEINRSDSKFSFNESPTGYFEDY